MSDDLTSKFLAIKTVYSYYAPETQQLIDEVANSSHDVFRKSTQPPSGLDDYHHAIFNKLIAFYENDVIGLSDFTYRYPTSGSEEGIKEFMTCLQTKGVKSIYTLRHDYEGYKEVASTRGIHPIAVNEFTDPRTLKPGYWFISNPSARNGCLLSDGLINNICEAGHKVFYDLAYLGSTHPTTFDVTHPNIIAVVHSLSKPYGLFYHRIGFTFSREPIPSLYANKWFKNIFGLLIANKLFEQYTSSSYSKVYKPIQRRIIEHINKACGIQLWASDAFLLAYLPFQKTSTLDQARRDLIAPYHRGDYYRFCLTKYFEHGDDIHPYKHTTQTY